MVEKKTVKIAIAGAAALALIIGLSVGLTQNNSPRSNAVSASTAEGSGGFNFEEDCTTDVIHGKSGKSTYGSGKSNKGGSRRLGRRLGTEMAGDMEEEPGVSTTKSGSGTKGTAKSNTSYGSGKSGKSNMSYGSGKSGKSSGGSGGSGKSGKSGYSEQCWNECEINWSKSGKSDMSYGSGKSGKSGSGSGSKSGGPPGSSGSGSKSGKSKYDVCEPPGEPEPEPSTKSGKSGPEPVPTEPPASETETEPTPSPSSSGTTTVATGKESGLIVEAERGPN